MSKIVAFLESVGADADQRGMTLEKLELALAEQCGEEIGSLRDRTRLDALVGAAKIVFCGVMRPDEEEEEEEPGKEDDEIRTLHIAAVA